jgi:putative protease
MKLGVSSFKIEGRLKKPDYIANVVAAYRLIIDEAWKGETTPPQKALDMISKTSSRSFSTGFSSKKAFKNLIESERMGVTGSLCGKVLNPVYNGFMAEVSRRIHVGDILRVQKHAGDNSVSLAVSTITIDGEIVSKATTGDVCFIRCDREAPAGADIFKTGESFDKMTEKLANLPQKRRDIDLKIVLNEKLLTVDSNEFGHWESAVETQPAKKAPISGDTLDKCFKASNSETLAAGTITSVINGSFFIPASELKKIRREFWKNCATLENKLNKRILAQKAELLSKMNDYISQKIERPFIPPLTISKKIQSDDLSSASQNTTEVVLPTFIPEDKLEALKDRIKEITNNLAIRKFRITSLYQIPILMRLKNIEIAVSFPFPICNSLAVREVRKLLKNNGEFSKNIKLNSIEAWVELEEHSILDLVDHSPVQVEMLVEGHIPILVTRADIPVEGKINDDRGANYFVKRDPISGITYIYPEKILKLPTVPGTIPRKINKLSESRNPMAATFNFNREFT